MDLEQPLLLQLKFSKCFEGWDNLEAHLEDFVEGPIDSAGQKLESFDFERERWMSKMSQTKPKEAKKITQEKF